MICGNCGFQNKPGDEFCGSCGHFLAWSGSAEESAGLSGPSAPPPPSAGGVAADSPTVVAPVPISSRAATPPPPPPPTPAQAAINWPAGLQRCDVCGTANELSRTFCLNCGAKLKRAGTTSGAALAVAAAQQERRRGMLMIGYAVLGALLFVVAAAAAFVALGGLSPAAPPAVPATPLASLVAANPSASSLPVVSPLASLGLPASGEPLVTAPASLEPPPTEVPSAPVVTAPPPSVPPATVPPPGGFVCAASTFTATQPGNWRIFHAHWMRRLSADTIFFEFQPTASASTASVAANILPPDQVQATYGVPGPSSGDVAVVLAFNDAVGASSSFGSQVGYKTLQEFQIYKTPGQVIVVMGVTGAGCYGLSSDAWTTGSSGEPELEVAFQH